MIDRHFHIRPDVIEWAKRVAPIAPPKRAHVPPDFIVAHVAAAHGVTLDDMLSTSRAARVVAVRQVAMYLCRRLGHASMTEVAMICRKTDHTIVLYSERRVADRIAESSALGNWISELSASIVTSYGDYRQSRLPAVTAA